MLLEVVANPINIYEYSTYSWIFNISMEMVYAIDGFLLMRWVEYDHEEVPISMDKYFIHGRNILSMNLNYPWVPCNRYPFSAKTRLVSAAWLKIIAYFCQVGTNTGRKRDLDLVSTSIRYRVTLYL